MIRGGMTVARINMSHNGKRSTTALVKNVRAAAAREGRSVPLLFDLTGGKVRLGRMGKKPVVLSAGQRFDLLPGSRAKTTATEAAIGYSDLAKYTESNESVLIDDGRIELRVVEVTAGRIRTEVVRGGELRSNIGATLKNTELPFPAMTSKDRRKLKIAVDNGADWIGVSLVQSERNVLAVRRALRRLGAKNTKVVAKIESRMALENLDAILDASDAIMIARGDLSVAVGPERLAEAQAKIARRAQEKGVPFITASNLLSATVDGSAPSQANAKDVQGAVDQKPQWLMLNETALGARPDKIVRDASELIDRSVLARPRARD